MRDRRVAVLLVSLRSVEPKVWRRVRVPETIRLDRLHWVIQAAMGWEGQHEYQFEIGGRRFVVDPDSDTGEAEVTDVRKATLAKLKPRRGEVFQYTYDLGDWWEHDVVLEALDWEADGDGVGAAEFVCSEGAMACPPEDSGGAATYTAAVEHRDAGGNGKHPPDREAAEAVLDDDFDPRAFSPASATHVLRLMAAAGVFGEYA
jgi:Plasmid pRiA4b ORF-3-like protein